MLGPAQEVSVATNRLAEAEPLYKRALAILQESLGPEHPKSKDRAGESRGAAARDAESTGV